VRSAVSALLAVALLTLGTEPENLTGRYRALTLNPGERRELHALGLERVTGASGACIEEGMSSDSVETMFVQANCSSVRTTIAWLQKSVRIHILICAEGEEREAALVKQREKAQREFKAWKGVTVCVRGPEVQLLGWAASPAERDKLAAKAKKLGLVDKVELLGEKEREGEDSAPGE
jgi:hypothetical protein